MEVEEERSKGRKLRQMIRATIQEQKSEKKWPNRKNVRFDGCLKPVVPAGESLRTRRAWGSNMSMEAARGGRSQMWRSCSGLPVSSWSSVSGLTAIKSSSISLNLKSPPTPNLSR